MSDASTIENPTVFTSSVIGHKEEGWKLFKGGKFEDSLHYFDLHLTANADDLWYLHDRARAQIEVGDAKHLSQAKNTLQQLSITMPNDAQIHASLAVAYGRSGEYDKCLTSYTKSLELDPNNFEAQIISPLNSPPLERSKQLHDKGLEELRHDKPREALRFYEAAIAVGGETQTPWSVHDRGMALMTLGFVENGMKSLEKSCVLIPENSIPLKDTANAYISLAGNLRNLGKGVLQYPLRDIAKQYYARAWLLNPNDTETIRALEQTDIYPEDIPTLHSYSKIKQEDKPIQWKDENNNEIRRNTDRERSTIDTYFSHLRQSDPEYFQFLETLIQSEGVEPMNTDCRIAINIPTFMEGRNIYKTLDMIVKQTDRKGISLNPSLYEINIIVNRMRGASSDNTIDEIQRFIHDNDKFHINFINVEYDAPCNRIGYVRRVITDMTLLRANDRSSQTGALYIESEDADLLKYDPHTIINAIETLDEKPYLDAVRGIQDYDPEKIMENDFLFLQRRLWQFAESEMGNLKYRPENNPKWNRKWNRVITGGWNTTFSAEAYALIGGYHNIITGSDMNIGERITAMRGDGITENTDVIGRVPTHISSSPRRFIEAIIKETNPYGDIFDEPEFMAVMRELDIDEQLKKIGHLARISDTNIDQFQQIFTNLMPLFREVTPDASETRSFLHHVLSWTGFEKDDYSIDDNGSIKIGNWENIKKRLEAYRKSHPADNQKV